MAITTLEEQSWGITSRFTLTQYNKECVYDSGTKQPTENYFDEPDKIQKPVLHHRKSVY